MKKADKCLINYSTKNALVKRREEGRIINMTVLLIEIVQLPFIKKRFFRKRFFRNMSRTTFVFCYFTPMILKKHRTFIFSFTRHNFMLAYFF